MDSIVDFKRSAVTIMLKAIGEDPDRTGLKETPDRVVNSWKELYSGYKQDPAKIFKVFDEPTDQMVIVRDLEFWSMCEHHMLPFFGKAHIGYLPKNGKVLGVSKIGRLLEVFARRLQIQERLCREITSTMMEHLDPQGCGCIIEAKHLCMICRGHTRNLKPRPPAPRHPAGKENAIDPAQGFLHGGPSLKASAW